MFDTHAHILPALDDGPCDLASALEICRSLTDQGVTRAIATPHQLGCFAEVSAAQIRRKTAELNQVLTEQGINLEVFPGAEVHLDERIPQLLKQDKIVTLADNSRYLLLELSSEVAMDITPLLDQLGGVNCAVIIAHAERNLFAWRDPRLLHRWLEHGAVLQVTAAGLAGQWGGAVRDFGWYLVLSGLVSLVASDVHDNRLRASRLRQVYDSLAGRLGRSLADRLCQDNPARIVSAQPLHPLFGQPRSSRRIIDIPAAAKQQPQVQATGFLK